MIAGRQAVQSEQRGAEHRRGVEHGDLRARRDRADRFVTLGTSKSAAPRASPPAIATGTASASRPSRRIDAVANAAISSAMSSTSPIATASPSRAAPATTGASSPTRPLAIRPE